MYIQSELNCNPTVYVAPEVDVSDKDTFDYLIHIGPVLAAVESKNGVMYNFLYRLINIVLPRVRDFRGISPKSFDGVGNYNFGLTDQSVFTEIDLDKIKHTIGMNITIVTTAKTDDEARDLLTLLGMPFATSNNN